MSQRMARILDGAGASGAEPEAPGAHSVAPLYIGGAKRQRFDVTPSSGFPTARARTLLALLMALMVGHGTGCVGTSGRPYGEVPFEPALRVSDWAERGDPQRRASTRLVLEGLDADAAGRTTEARAQYRRALQVDSTNPLAYLAFARHEVFAGDPARADGFLDQAEARFAGAADEMGARPHLDGLRGAALPRGQRPDSSDRSQNPRGVWSDGILDAAELR